MIELNENVTKEMNKYLEGITIEEVFLLLEQGRKTFHFQVIFTNDQMKQEVEVLEKLKDALTEQSSLSECEGFVNGFRLGVRLIAEVFYCGE